MPEITRNVYFLCPEGIELKYEWDIIYHFCLFTINSFPETLNNDMFRCVILSSKYLSLDMCNETPFYPSHLLS